MRAGARGTAAIFAPPSAVSARPSERTSDSGPPTRKETAVLSSANKRSGARVANHPALLLALAVGLVFAGTGCGGGSDEPAATPPASMSTAAETTRETGPEPMTRTERAWWDRLDRYVGLFKREAFRGGQVTHASLRHDAKLARKCRSNLIRGAHPGRFRPAFEVAKRACERLDKAARWLDEAIASSGPGGVVLAGTPDAQRFDKALGASGEAIGNAQYDLMEAHDTAKAVASRITED
jgi:hypothetical protein